jgi:hypothetical protein
MGGQGDDGTAPARASPATCPWPGPATHPSTPATTCRPLDGSLLNKQAWLQARMLQVSAGAVLTPASESQAGCTGLACHAPPRPAPPPTPPGTTALFTPQCRHPTALRFFERQTETLPRAIVAAGASRCMACTQPHHTTPAHTSPLHSAAACQLLAHLTSTPYVPPHQHTICPASTQPALPAGHAPGRAAQVGGALFDVVINPPSVEGLRLPARPMAGYPILPACSLLFAQVRSRGVGGAGVGWLLLLHHSPAALPRRSARRTAPAATPTRARPAPLAGGSLPLALAAQAGSRRRPRPQQRWRHLGLAGHRLQLSVLHPHPRGRGLPAARGVHARARRRARSAAASVVAGARRQRQQPGGRGRGSSQLCGRQRAGVPVRRGRGCGGGAGGGRAGAVGGASAVPGGRGGPHRPGRSARGHVQRPGEGLRLL